MNRGSIWRKWNFHVHTKGTNKNDQFKSSTMEEFWYTFYKKSYENNISAIGITDYFSIEKYLEAVEYRNFIGNKKDANGNNLFNADEVDFIKSIFIFPNVELRVIPTTKKGKCINLHFLFDPNFIGLIDNEFFNKLSNLEGVLMNRKSIIEYGRNFHDSPCEELLYKLGIENYNIEFGRIKKLLEQSNFLTSHALVAVSSKSKDGVSGLKDYYSDFENEGGALIGTMQSIYKKTAIIFSNAPSDKNYFMGKTTSKDEVIKKEGSLKPCVIGCDSHTESDLFTKFTWVKGDLNFEGLRQICFEPEQRANIQDSIPDVKEDKLVISKVRFICPSKKFSTKPIFLNPNLNVIIGGKSSGKSILLYLIAKTLLANEKILNNKDGSDKYKFEKDFDFEIETNGGFNQKLNKSSSENSILPEIKYIPQNYLVRLAEPEQNKTGRDLNHLIRDLITEDSTSKELYDEFVNAVKHNDRLRNIQLDDYFQLKKDIKSLEDELKMKSNSEVLRQNIESNLKRIEELNKNIGLTQEQVDEYKKLQEQLDENAYKSQCLKDDFFAVKDFNIDVFQLLKGIKLKKDIFLKELKTKEIKSHYEVFYSGLDSILDAYNTALSELESYESLISNPENKSNFGMVHHQLSENNKFLEESINPFMQDEQAKKIIEMINQSIAQDKKALDDIESLANKIEDKKILLNSTTDEIFKIYRNSYEQYISVIDALKSRTIELEKDGLSIIGKVTFNYPKLRSKLIDDSDGRSASYNRYELLNEEKKATDDTDFEFIFSQIKELFSDIVEKKYILSKKVTIESVIKSILADYFFDFWEISYKNDKLGEMSTGKASFVILMLIVGLSRSKAPILIDQPEDNLDNRSITTDLVNYLRNKKLERQIIVVTHNANIVVNADAENVIVANQLGQNNDESTSPFKFDYINGAIENSFDKKANEQDVLQSMGIRQHIADIVEGGKDAFIMREKKYRFR